MSRRNGSGKVIRMEPTKATPRVVTGDAAVELRTLYKQAVAFSQIARKAQEAAQAAQTNAIGAQGAAEYARVSAEEAATAILVSMGHSAEDIRAGKVRLNWETLEINVPPCEPTIPVPPSVEEATAEDTV